MTADAEEPVLTHRVHAVLDTNTIIKDRFLRGPEFRLLKAFKYMPPCFVDVSVPEVVIMEACNRFREQVESKLSKLRTAARDLERFLARPLGIPLPDELVAKEVGGYEAALRERLDNWLEVEHIGHELIDHEELLKRDLARRRPFQRNGKGCRDALIWEGILRDVASANWLTVLVTQNTSDFGAPDGKGLHPDLKRDLENRRLPRDCVDLCETVFDFNRPYLHPHLKRAEGIEAALAGDTYPSFSLREYFQRNLDRVVAQLQARIDDMDLTDISELVPGGPEIRDVELPVLYPPEDLGEVTCSILPLDLFKAWMERGVRDEDEVELADALKPGDRRILLVTWEYGVSADMIFLVQKSSLDAGLQPAIRIIDPDATKWFARAFATFSLQVEGTVLLLLAADRELPAPELKGLDLDLVADEVRFVGVVPRLESR